MIDRQEVLLQIIRGNVSTDALILRAITRHLAATATLGTFPANSGAFFHVPLNCLQPLAQASRTSAQTLQT